MKRENVKKADKDGVAIECTQAKALYHLVDTKEGSEKQMIQAADQTILWAGFYPSSMFQFRMANPTLRL